VKGRTGQAERRQTKNHATEKDSSGGGCPSTETTPGRWRCEAPRFSSRTERRTAACLREKSGAVDSSTTKTGRRRGTLAHGRENLRTAARCGRNRAKPGRRNPSAIEEMNTGPVARIGDHHGGSELGTGRRYGRRARVKGQTRDEPLGSSIDAESRRRPLREEPRSKTRERRFREKAHGNEKPRTLIARGERPGGAHATGELRNWAGPYSMIRTPD
jgi:hypothetical protein